MYEREVKDYCRRAGSLLACGRAQRQRFDHLTRQSVQDYLQEAPDAPWPEVEQVLGSPEEAAGAFMETLPPGAAEQWAAAHKRRQRLAVVFVGLVLVLLAGIVVFFFATKGVVIIETETTIVYDTEGAPPATPPPLE